MAKAKLIVLSKPVSPDCEDEYNKWYNEVHAKEVVALPGMLGITRFRATRQVNPPQDEMSYQYLAIYDMEDSEATIAALMAAQPKLSISDAIDLDKTVGVAFEPIFAYKKAD